MKKNSENGRQVNERTNEDSSQYWRPLSNYRKERILKKYEHHLKESYGGFLSLKRRKRLLGISHKEKQTRDSDFWSKLRLATRDTLIDLQLFCEVANDSQLEEIFQPFTAEDYNNIKKERYTRTDLKTLLDSILTLEQTPVISIDHWKYKLAVDIINVGLNYVSQKKEFQTNLHSRLFQDVRDSIGMIWGTSAHSSLG